MSEIDAVIFDMDGVLIDSEHLWDEVREEYVRERGGQWHERAQRDMMGMSSAEWPRYMHDRLGVPLPPQQIDREVVDLIQARYATHLPMIPGAREAVERLAARWPLGLASSSNRPVIDRVLEESGLGRFFKVTVSSEEVPRGKPAPDVYLRAAALLKVEPARCAGVEDSHNGMLAVHAAGMRTIAIPNKRYPPDPEALSIADAVLDSITALSAETVTGSPA